MLCYQGVLISNSLLPFAKWFEEMLKRHSFSFFPKVPCKLEELTFIPLEESALLSHKCTGREMRCCKVTPTLLHSSTKASFSKRTGNFFPSFSLVRSSHLRVFFSRRCKNSFCYVHKFYPISIWNQLMTGDYFCFAFAFLSFEQTLKSHCSSSSGVRFFIHKFRFLCVFYTTVAIEGNPPARMCKCPQFFPLLFSHLNDATHLEEGEWLLKVEGKGRFGSKKWRKGNPFFLPLLPGILFQLNDCTTVLRKMCF